MTGFIVFVLMSAAIWERSDVWRCTGCGGKHNRGRPLPGSRTRTPTGANPPGNSPGRFSYERPALFTALAETWPAGRRSA